VCERERERGQESNREQFVAVIFRNQIRGVVVEPEREAERGQEVTGQCIWL
jgi:hypothetical protein